VTRDISKQSRPPGRADRRTFLRQAGLLGLAVASAGLASACGVGSTPAPAQPAQAVPPSGQAASTTAPATTGDAVAKSAPINIGFIPLTDCASVVMAHELGLYAKHGVNVQVVKEASWATVRDKLITGENQASHCLFGMPFSVYTGVGGTAEKELLIGMGLNTNGQAITLSNDFVGKVGFKEIDRVGPAVEEMRAKKEVTFAMTFPGGTHDMWLRYWLAAARVPQSTVKIITIPPPQMVANMKSGNMDGFCVGEPWPGVAVEQGIGFTHIATQDMWKHHPEKALVYNKAFVEQRRDDAKAVMSAVMEASIWLDNLDNRAKAATTIGGQAYVNAPAKVVDDRLKGHYQLGGGLGERSYTDDYMLFHNGGQVNFPRLGHAAWFMTQYVRFEYLKTLPDTQGIARKLILQDLYREVAKEMSVPVPDDDMKPFTIGLDGATFDPTNPAQSLQGAEGARV
jgi:nitrate/nitrite transport system substrate-binding protein